MRRTPLLVLGILFVGAGCGDPNAGALYADFRYATRCEETLGCAGPQMHDICGFNLSDPCTDGPQAQLSCTVIESETTRTLSFSAAQGGDFSIRVSGAVVPRGGGAATGSCEVTVVEGPNTYEGICGSSLPSEAQPCQITNVMFTNDAGNNPVVSGDIWCQHMPNRATPNLAIELTNVGDGPEPANMPAEFYFANCDGLSLDE